MDGGSQSLRPLCSALECSTIGSGHLGRACGFRDGDALATNCRLIPGVQTPKHRNVIGLAMKACHGLGSSYCPFRAARHSTRRPHFGEIECIFSHLRNPESSSSPPHVSRLSASTVHRPNQMGLNGQRTSYRGKYPSGRRERRSRGSNNLASKHRREVVMFDVALSSDFLMKKKKRTKAGEEADFIQGAKTPAWQKI